ncbi:MAG: hypothetical protein NXH79_13725 [Rhodobacteraceae bacterium]|nr:hypothetical protein [Paracoccaceae bacterium]
MDRADAALIKGMLARGDRQHDIAAWFGVNGGRIAEIATGAKFANVSAATKNLPPSGPYSSGKDIEDAKKNLLEVRESLSDLLDRIDQQIAKLS